MNDVIFERELSKLRDTIDSTLSWHNTFFQNLTSSGILSLLKRKAVPAFNSSKDLVSNALESGRAAGYQEALDDLCYFPLLYLMPVKEKPSLYLDSIERAFETGNITKEERDALRAGKSPDYAAITAAANTPLPRRG